MSRTSKSKGISILGPLEYDERTGEPGIHINSQWYGALELLDQVFGQINSDLIKEKAEDFKRRQQVEPVQLANEPGHGRIVELWAYHNKVVQYELKAVTQVDLTDKVLLVKHCVLSAEADMEKVRREVQAFENFEKLPVARRERIPKETQMFVWQRDEGKCVECGARADLAFDHIIPVVEGGATTARNIQLLCQPCNRRKGRSV